MNTTRLKLFFSVAITVWWLSSSGCTSTQAVKPSSLPQSTTALFDEEAPPSSSKTLIDTETFTAFCDRA